MDAMVHHSMPPQVIHLENVVPAADPIEPDSTFDIHKQPESYLALPAGVSAHVDEFWKQPQAAHDRSAENQVDNNDGADNSASADFYNMVLDILDTFHSAAEVEVRRSRKREFQRQAAMDMLI